MTGWQVSMLLGLPCSGAASLVAWLRAARKFNRANAFAWPVPAVIRFGWLGAIAPLVEMWVLYMGDFW